VNDCGPDPGEVCAYQNPIRNGRILWSPDEGRVAHISLVFREMWDSTALSL
jgi:hypothetical protein